MREQLSGLLGGTGGQLCFLRDGSLATEPPNLYHCHSYLHYTDHTCLAEWANLLQHDLPGRNVFGIDLPFFRFQAGYRYVQMQWLRLVYPQLQSSLYQCESTRDRLQPLRRLHGLYRQMPAGSHPIYTQKNKQGGNRKTNKAEIQTAQPAVDKPDRRKFFTVSALLATSAALKAQEKVQLPDKKVDGGLAIIEDKKKPDRTTPITPPGSLSAANFSRHCTACQLCVSVCTNHVLRPSGNLQTFMQPEVSYERGYCRPECVKCSEVCPTGAIRPITKADKTAIQIGHAVLIQENCIVNRDGVTCGNCARHCPTQAILMVAKDPNDPDSPQLPVVNEEKCIGCGACENLCPSRPFSAIYVEGHEQHRNI